MCLVLALARRAVRGNWSAMSLLENSDPKEEILMELQKEGTSSEVQEEDSVEETSHSLLDQPKHPFEKTGWPS